MPARDSAGRDSKRISAESVQRSWAAAACASNYRIATERTLLRKANPKATKATKRSRRRFMSCLFSFVTFVLTRSHIGVPRPHFLVELGFQQLESQLHLL